MKKKTVALLLALTLVLGVAAGGTIAWLTDKTDTVTNTFAPTGINIKLEEYLNPDGSKSEDPLRSWEAPLVPGATYSKDPVVSVSSDSEDCYLFVKVTNGADGLLDFKSGLTADKGWTAGTKTDTDEGNGVPVGVWYRIVKKGSTPNTWNLIDEDKVTVSEDVTKSNMPTGKVTLTYTAYACQYYKDNTPNVGSTDNVDANGHYFTAAEAWAKIGD